MPVKVTMKVERPSGQVVLSQSEVPEGIPLGDPALEREADRIGNGFRMAYTECQLLPDTDTAPKVSEP